MLSINILLVSPSGSVIQVESRNLQCLGWLSIKMPVLLLGEQRAILHLGLFLQVKMLMLGNSHGCFHQYLDRCRSYRNL